jgi:phosphatidylethanolamine/phosphatidyl-N-methylethanolamine N-methyltransferase
MAAMSEMICTRRIGRFSSETSEGVITMLIGPQDGLFFSRWLRRPLRTGAVVPSGRSLARLMASQVDPGTDGLVVELGAGTGVITEALLAHGLEPRRLLVVEQDEAMHGLLLKRFPAARVVCADALQLDVLLRAAGAGQAAAVVSSLPLLSMSERRRQPILKQIFGCLAPGAALVQYTYRPGAPVGAKDLPPWRLEAFPVGRCWRNVPPATVWRITPQLPVGGHGHD